MDRLKKKSTQQTKRTKIVGIISCPNDYDYYLQNDLVCDLIEIRIDLWPDFSDFNKIKHPILLTARNKIEGGAMIDWNDEINIITLHLDQIDYLDLEILLLEDNIKSSEKLISLAREKNKQIIGSYHNFETTPDSNFLKSLEDKAKLYSLDLLKLATMTNNTRELCELATFQESCEFPLATMGMGKHGSSSRLLLSQLGSQLAYGSLSKPLVPGQLTIAELNTIFDTLNSPNI